MAKIETVNSIGIDIGTTTMSMVVSQLKIENTASGLLIPQIKIIDKRTVFRSEMMQTPYINRKTIDFAGVEELILREYARAGVSPSDIHTGAIIVTGEAARKENAEVVSRAVSRMSGSFVVATAGAHLEASISGLGAGASRYSSKNNARIINLDIGGGTTNSSIYERGSLAGTFCSDVGGRLIKFLPGTNIVDFYTDNAAFVAEKCGISLQKGMSLDKEQIVSITDNLAESLISILKDAPNELAVKLSIGSLPDFKMNIDVISLSGGVGRLFYEKELDRDMSLDRLLRYDDIGVALARSLQQRLALLDAESVQLQETIYATVIGAGVHVTNLSGSTIYVSDYGALPVRDIPVVRFKKFSDDVKTLEALSSKIRAFSDGHSVLPAIVIERVDDVGFINIKKIADLLCDTIENLETPGPVVVICENDIGKFVGNVLKNRLKTKRSIISIDQVKVSELDYVDIGEAIYGDSVVPVAVKTLIFSE